MFSIPEHITKTDLANAFKTLNLNYFRIYLIKKQNGQNTGYAFIEFLNNQDKDYFSNYYPLISKDLVQYRC